MNAPLPIGHLAIQSRAATLDASFIRRVREASLHELRLLKRAHLNMGQCGDLYGGGCWRCAAIRRAEGK